MSKASSQPTKARTLQTIEYGPTAQGPWEYFAALEGQGDQIRVYQAVHACRDKHPRDHVRLSVSQEYLYEPLV